MVFAQPKDGVTLIDSKAQCAGGLALLSSVVRLEGITKDGDAVLPQPKGNLRGRENENPVESRSIRGRLRILKSTVDKQVDSLPSRR